MQLKWRDFTLKGAFYNGAVPIAVSLALLLGCAPVQHPADRDVKAIVPMAPPPDQPQEVTDLARLSAVNTNSVPILAQTPVSVDATPASTTRNDQVTQRMAADAPSLVYSQEVEPDLPGGSRLLNAKARQFAEFSDILVLRTLKAAEKLEPEDLHQRKLPSDLRAVLLTAVMDPQGRLNEIVIEQHSGDLSVDHLIIDACKKAIWSRNPPPGARASDGNYRVQIEANIYNSTFDRYGQYTYDTRLGIGLL